VSADLSDYEKKILENIEQFGCHVTTVFDPDGDDPSYAYSSGFSTTVKQGEVIVFGLDHDVMHRVVNIVLDKCENGLELTDGLAITDVLEGFDVVARTIPEKRIDNEHFNSAKWFHRRIFGTELDRAFQIVWPGAVDGLFPWDPRSDAWVCSRQPPLYSSETLQ
jgi:hypothetical protein